ncbi:MAG: hypothetical protein IID60_00155 [Proteobacteria bacterium]|nr:hypothetical protein [Pseudomonadota bacterium]
MNTRCGARALAALGVVTFVTGPVIAGEPPDPASETSAVMAADVPGLELQWAVAYPGATRDCQPPSPRSLA